MRQLFLTPAWPVAPTPSRLHQPSASSMLWPSFCSSTPRRCLNRAKLVSELGQRLEAGHEAGVMKKVARHVHVLTHRFVQNSIKRTASKAASLEAPACWCVSHLHDMQKHPTCLQILKTQDQYACICRHAMHAMPTRYATSHKAICQGSTLLVKATSSSACICVDKYILT